MDKRMICLVALFMMIAVPAFSADIDLDSAFDIEGDGIIHFGDQTIDHFMDTTSDYNNQITVTVTFSVNEAPVPSTPFSVIMDHYGARPDIGYNSFFTIGSYSSDYLQKSDDTFGAVDHDYDGNGTIDWTHQIFTGSVDDLNLVLGDNNITFHVGTVGSNQNEVEVTNFELQYESTPVPLPGAVCLLGSGLLCFFGLARRRLKEAM